MNIWMSYGFKKLVRDNVGGREERVWELLDLYSMRPDVFESDRRNNDYKLLDSYTVGQNACKVFKYRIDDGSRLFLVQFDADMAEKVHLLREEDDDREAPQAGDFCFIGVTGTDKHDRQGSFGSYFAKRFLNKLAVERYRLREKTVVETEDIEERNDKTLKLNVSAATYAAQLPFESYEDYVEQVSDPDVKLSEEQYDILGDIVSKSRKRTTILMGCAGSGKTLMAVTVLLCNRIGYSASVKKRMYFALSDRLAVSSESSFAKIIACKAVSDIEWTEDSRYPWRKQFLSLKAIAMQGSRIRLSDLLRRAEDQGIPAQEVLKRLETPNAEFCEANDYLCSLLGKDKRRLVLYNRFKTEFFDRKFGSERNLNADDVWAEIRGLIKGYHGAHAHDKNHSWYWGRCEFRQMRDMFPVMPNQYDLSKVQRALIDQGCVVPPKQGIGGFVWTDVSEAKEAAVISGLPEQRMMIEQMFQKVRENDYSKRAMTLAEYLGLGSTQSVFEQKDRRRVYEIYKDYEMWLDGGSLFDENDLARETLDAVAEGDIEPLDLDVGVVDECQDFSEMQLMAVTSLFSGESRVVFAGDRHQIINPTYFAPERLRSIASLRNDAGEVEYEQHFISDNHRSSRQIVGIANVVAKMRRDHIGSIGERYEKDEASSVEGFYPHFLDYGTGIDGLAGGLEQVAEDPNVAFIVHDDLDKRRLMDLLPPDLRRSAAGNAFTIKECKGLEFKKVFCFDILGKYRKEWGEILSHRGVKHREDRQKYRYYFNTLYVSITRSQSGICLMESSEAQATHRSWLVEPGRFRRETPREFDQIVAEFDLKAGTAREWFLRAEEHFRNAEDSHDASMYSRALNAFTSSAEKSDADDSVRRLAEEGGRKCEIEIAKLNRRFIDAAKLCVRYRLTDRMPELKDVSDEERPDVQLMLDLLEKGFHGMFGTDLERAVSLFADSEAGRDYVRRAFELKIEDISLAAKLESEELHELTRR